MNVITKQLIGCGIPIFWAGAVTFGYIGVVSPSWHEMFGMGSAETGFVVTCQLLAGAATMFLGGYVHSKAGMARCVAIGTACYLASPFILLAAQAAHQIYLWAFVANVGCSFIYGPGIAMGQLILPEKKGLISGVLNLTFGGAGALLSPLFSELLATVGYTLANIVLFSLIAATNAVAWLLLKRCETPRRRGEGVSTVAHEGVSVSQALRTRNFWLIWLVWLFMGAAGVSMVSLSESYAVSLGAAGISLLVAFNLANGVSRIFVGLSIDRIGPKTTGIIAFPLTVAGYLLMPHAPNAFLASLCAVGIGIGYGTMFTITGPLVSDLFGMKNFGIVFGIIFIAYGLFGGLAGPTAAGTILEAPGGNYGIAFTYLGTLALASLVLMSLVRSRR